MGQVGSSDAQDESKLDSVIESHDCSDSPSKAGQSVTKSSHVKDQIDSLIEAYLTDPKVDGNLSEVTSTNNVQNCASLATLTKLTHRISKQDVTTDVQSVADFSSDDRTNQEKERSNATVAAVGSEPAPHRHIKLKALIDRVLEASISTDVLSVDDKRYDASESLFKNIANNSPDKTRQLPLQPVKENIMSPVTSSYVNSSFNDKVNSGVKPPKKENSGVVSSNKSMTVVEHKVYNVSEIIERVFKETDVAEGEDNPKILSMYDKSHEVHSPEVNHVSHTKKLQDKPSVEPSSEPFLQKQYFMDQIPEKYKDRQSREYYQGTYNEQRSRAGMYDVSTNDAYDQNKRGVSALSYYKYPEKVSPSNYSSPNHKVYNTPEYTHDYPLIPVSSPKLASHGSRKPIVARRPHKLQSEYMYQQPYAQRLSPSNSPPPLLKLSPQGQHPAMMPGLLPAYPWIQGQTLNGFSPYTHSVPRASSPRLPHLYQTGMRPTIPYTSVPHGYHTTTSPWQLAPPEVYQSPSHRLSIPQPKLVTPAVPAVPSHDEYRIITVDHTYQPCDPNQQPLMCLPSQQHAPSRLKQDATVPNMYRRSSLSDVSRTIMDHRSSAPYEQRPRRDHPSAPLDSGVLSGVQEDRSYSHPKQMTPYKYDTHAGAHAIGLKPSKPRTPVTPVTPRQPITPPHCDRKCQAVGCNPGDCHVDSKHTDDSPLDLSSHNIIPSHHNITSPRNIVPSPHNIVPSPHKSAYSAHNIDPSPHMVPSPRNIVPSPQNIVPSPRNIVPSPHNIVPSPRNVVPSPHKSAYSTHNIDPSPHMVSSPHNIVPCHISPDRRGNYEVINADKRHIPSQAGNGELVFAGHEARTPVDGPLKEQLESQSGAALITGDDARVPWTIGRSRSSQGSTPSPSSLTHSPTLSDTSGHRYISKAGRKCESFNNLIGDHSPTDILFLICKLCGQTYGSPYGFRRHFRSQHHCEPLPQHAHIKTISEAKKAQQSVKHDFPSLKAEMIDVPDNKNAVLSDDPPVLLMEKHVDIVPTNDKDKDMSDSTKDWASEESGERWLVCHECQMRFKLNDFGVYRRHCRTHEKIRVKSTAQYDANQDITNSSLEKFECLHCQEKLIGSNSFDEHMSACKLKNSNLKVDCANDSSYSLPHRDKHRVSHDVNEGTKQDVANAASMCVNKLPETASNVSPRLTEDVGIEYRHKKFGRLLKPSISCADEPPEKRIKSSSSDVLNCTSSSPQLVVKPRVLQTRKDDIPTDKDAGIIEGRNSPSSKKGSIDKRETRHNLPFVWDRVTRSKSINAGASGTK